MNSHACADLARLQPGVSSSNMQNIQSLRTPNLKQVVSSNGTHETDINENIIAMPSSNPNVKLETSVGDIIVELYWHHAPRTCHNFHQLAIEGYYDSIIFHRIVKNFVVQGGDPTGTGKGGVSVYGSTFADEVHPDLKHVGAGILSMANAGPNTNSSQFFITLAPTPWLDGKHTIFGRVKRGMQTVLKMSLVATDPYDRPLEDIKIFHASICE